MQPWDPQKTYAVFSAPANKKIAAEIEGARARVVYLPAAEIESVRPDDGAQKLLRNLADFEWVIFPDVFAVEHFLLALERLGIDFYELDAARVCASGEAVSDRLRYAQIHADVISGSVETNQVFGALRDYEPAFGGKRFLLAGGQGDRPGIADRLREHGAEVTEIPVYRTRVEDAAALTKLKALLKGGAVDEFVFRSPDEVARLAVLFRPESPHRLLAGIEISAADASTHQSLREFGFVKIRMR